MTQTQILKSKIDDSINWVTKTDVGYLEARFVRRKSKLIAYVSSQTGCVQACRMCHLTSTGQTAHRNASAKEIVDQAKQALRYINTRERYAKSIHINFMARGEPLLNDQLLDNWNEISTELKNYVVSCLPRPEFQLDLCLGNFTN